MRRAVALPVVVAGALASFACGVSAQNAPTLRAVCLAAGGVDAVCLSTALAVQALLGHVGGAAGLGSDVPGTASNLGMRLGTNPRVSVALRASGRRVSMPLLSDPTGIGRKTFTVPAYHATIAVGLLDGFRIMPTVGGFLSIDVFGQVSIISVHESRGLGDRVTAYSVGARIGLVREGFTVPGVSMSVARRIIDSATNGATDMGDAAQFSIDPSVTSVRATVGKDLYGVEVMAGFGWESYYTDAVIGVIDGQGGLAVGRAPLDVSRALYFVGGGMTFRVVLSASVEVGFAQGYDPLPGYVGAYDARGRTPFGTLAFRLTI
jgi:hypothetical protein